MNKLALTLVLVLVSLVALTNGASVGNAITLTLGTGGPNTAWKWEKTCVRWRPDLAPLTTAGKLAKGRCQTVYVNMAGMYYVRFTSIPTFAGLNPLAILTVTSLMNGVSKPKLVSWKYVRPETPPTVVFSKGTYKVCVAGRNRQFDLCALELYKCMTTSLCGMEVKSRGIALLSQRS